jgi:cell division protein FtsA
VARREALAALDIGTSKVLGAVALPDDGGLRVLGVAGVASSGVRRGAVVDLAPVALAVTAVAERLRRAAGRSLPPVLLGSAGGELVSLNGYAELSLGDGGREVEPADVAELLGRAREVPLAPGYQLVHAIPQHYVVDGYDGCHDPVGMSARHLAVRAHLVACQETVLQNLQRAVEAGRVPVDDFAVAALGAAEAVLTAEERREGAVLVDLGAGSTQVVVAADGEPVLTASLPIGSEHVTQDIAVGLGLTRADAESLKVRHATADPRALAGGGRRVAVEGGGAAREIAEEELAEIVAARAEEIVQAVAELLGRVARGVRLAAGAVLTGGGSRLRGLEAVAMRTLGMPVRCRGPLGAPEGLAAPECAAVVGLLQLQARRRGAGAAPRPRVGPRGPAWWPWARLGTR